MISRDIQRVIISGATSLIGIALCEECEQMELGMVNPNASGNSLRKRVPEVVFEDGIKRLAHSFNCCDSSLLV